jgi:Kef-type K+ transport system membrane component KefB
MLIASSVVTAMSDAKLGELALAILLLIAGAHVLGHVASGLRQPKMIGEILAGVLLGPSVLGHFAPGLSAGIFGTGPTDPRAAGVAFLYSLGLLLLMFVSGSAVRHVLSGENRRPTLILFAVGTSAPFIATLLLTRLLPLERFMGTANSRSALVLIIAAVVAVTSIPIITKIFSDLGILHTRFASLMLGSAVMEDIALWGIAAVATAIASSASSSGQLTHTIVNHVLWNTGFVMVTLAFMPRVLRWLGHAPWNVLAQRSQVTWVMSVLFAYVAFGGAHGVNLAFAAFLAGYGVVGGMKSTERHTLRLSLDSVSLLSAGVFVPIYFAVIGFKLDFSKTFSPAMLATFLIGSSLIKMLCLTAAGRLAGFTGLPLLNLAVTSNARGGPGIVLAGIAYDAHIINASFFTTLVLTAVLTSQFCGWWLERQLRSGRSLLGDSDEAEAAWSAEETAALNGEHALELDIREPVEPTATASPSRGGTAGSVATLSKVAELSWTLSDLASAASETRIEATMRPFPGIRSVVVSVPGRWMWFRFQPENTDLSAVRQALADAGHPVQT